MSGYVYLITMEPDEYVKIGFTRSNPATRMAALQTGCPECLHLRGWWEASIEEERALHAVFDALRYQGEWFLNERKLSDFVLYFDEYRNKQAPRSQFLNAMFDCVYGAQWYPGGKWTEAEYNKSADYTPFKWILHDAFEMEDPA